MKTNYDDIINLTHPTSLTHKRMSIESRAAQFAPFSALTGYEDAIKETRRLTDKKIELTEEEKHNINQKILLFNQKISSNPKVTITYFVKDKTKEGGKYNIYNGLITKINMVELIITLENKIKINVNDIIDITEDIYENK